MNRVDGRASVPVRQLLEAASKMGFRAIELQLGRGAPAKRMERDTCNRRGTGQLPGIAAPLTKDSGMPPW